MNKNTLKLVAVGLAGYFIGFYEYKYKATKALLDVTCDQLKKEKEEVKDIKES